MYVKSLQITFFITLFFIVNCFGQTSSSPNNESEKWTRIETTDQELSLTLPPDYIVNAEKKRFGPIYKINGFSNDVIMELSIFEEMKSKDLDFLQPFKEMNSQSLKKKELLVILSFNNSNETALKNTIAILGDKNYYFISVTASDKKKPEIERFLYSIKIKGESLFQNPNAQTYPESSIAMKSLRTSPEIIEAKNRKPKKGEFKTEKIISANTNQIISYDGYSRPPIIVEQKFSQFRQPVEASIKYDIYLQTRLKVTILADGQVGDIAVIAAAGNNSYVDFCVDAARKSRFIPAQKNGVNADSTKIVDYNIRMFKNSTVITPEGVVTPTQPF